MHGVTWHDIYISRQILLKCSNLWCLARRLTTDNSTYFRGRGERRDDRIDLLGFHTVNDIVTASGDMMTTGEDVYILLLRHT